MNKISWWEERGRVRKKGLAYLYVISETAFNVELLIKHEACAGAVFYLFWSQCCWWLQKRGMVLLWASSCIPWLGHGELAQSTSELPDGIRSSLQNLQLCYEHKKYASEYIYRKRNRCLCPLNKFPSGLCNNLEYYFYLHPVRFSSGDKSQRANLFILIDAVPWIFIGGEKALAQPVVSHCQQTQSCCGLEDGQYLLFSNPCPHCLCDLGAEWCIDWEGKKMAPVLRS